VVPVIWRPPVSQGPRGSIAPTAFAALSFQTLIRKNPIHRPVPASELKASLRVEALAARRRVWEESGGSASEAIKAAGIQAIQAMRHIGVVSGYLPIRDELDPLPLLAVLHKRGFEIALPVIRPESKLIFRAWQPGSPLERAQFGLQEPGEDCLEVRPDLLLVPLLGFDRQGNRLGYGAGYYDSTLRSLRLAGRVVAAGIGFDEQEFPDIPREPQDEPLDMILTPSRVIACKD
jgi:5-formyltetrahydrofolate cyclo-ligase